MGIPSFRLNAMQALMRRFEALAPFHFIHAMRIAGPAAVEALFSGDIDLAYLGPSPALNAYVKSHGKAIRIISGSAGNGGNVDVESETGVGSRFWVDLPVPEDRRDDA